MSLYFGVLHHAGKKDTGQRHDDAADEAYVSLAAEVAGSLDEPELAARKFEKLAISRPTATRRVG